MSGDPDGISRRAFLRGRFRAGSRPQETEPGDSDTGPKPAWLRFPRTRQDVDAVAGPPGAARSRGRLVPILRPPGAVDEAAFLERCTRCEACAEACPHDAITKAPARFRSAAGTPWIDPARAPCRMCEGTPCIPACETGALSPSIPFRIGTALIQEQTCLAHQGTFCSVCSEQCPVPGAIRLENGRPRVEESACTGCGVCHHVCPAPENAVAILPAFARPQAPLPSGGCP